MPPIRRPPIPAGHTRLYRGTGPFEKWGGYTHDLPDEPATTGRWFTDDPHYGMLYTRAKWPLQYVDVPNEVAAKHDTGHSWSGESEHLLPRMWANRARQIPGIQPSSSISHTGDIYDWKSWVPKPPPTRQVPSVAKVGGRAALDVLGKTGALSMLLGAIASGGSRDPGPLPPEIMKRYQKRIKADPGPKGNYAS